MFERFTDRARRVVVLAQEESRLLNHNYIGTEHLLLGLVREAEGVAAKVLEGMGVSLERVRTSVETRIGTGSSSPSGHIPFTPRAKKVLELSLREALQLGHNYIGTEHILLGLVREGEGVAAQTLDEFGVELKAVRDAAIKMMGGRTSGTPSEAVSEAPATAVPPICPGCFLSLQSATVSKMITVRSEDTPPTEERRVVAVYCENCGRTLAVLPE